MMHQGKINSESLRYEISARYDLLEEVINISDKAIKISRIANPDDLLDALAESDPDSLDVKDERLPYWAEIWPSSIALSTYILRHYVDSKPINALELGCGIGLVGTTAALINWQVTFSDYQQDAIDLALLNAIQNKPDALVSSKLIDWRKVPENLSYDCLLAADIIYEERFFKPVFNCLKSLMSEDGFTLLSEPKRKIASSFFESVEANGLNCECLEDRDNITIYKISHSNSSK